MSASECWLRSRRQLGALGMALVCVLALGVGCGGEDEAPPDAMPRPDAAILTIGDICSLLTDVTCRRDAECFDFFDLPCDESYFRYCCSDDGICDIVNGVTLEEVRVCETALEEATCSEIDNDFPASCVGITSQGGLGQITSREQTAWSNFASSH